MNRKFFAIVLALALSGCSGGASRNAGLYDPRTLPAGPLGESIAYGHDIIVQTHRLMKPYVRADLDVRRLPPQRRDRKREAEASSVSTDVFRSGTSARTASSHCKIESPNVFSIA